MSLDVARGRCRQRDSPCGDIKVWDHEGKLSAALTTLVPMVTMEGK